MHDGSLATLEDVVDAGIGRAHYNDGGLANPHLSPKIRALGLTVEETGALVAFLRALDGEGYMDTAPAAFPE